MTSTLYLTITSGNVCKENAVEKDSEEAVSDSEGGSICKQGAMGKEISLLLHPLASSPFVLPTSHRYLLIRHLCMSV